MFSSTIGVGYSFFLFNSVFFLNLKQNFIIRYKDLTRIETNSVFFVSLLVVFFGIFPNKVLFMSEMSVRYLLVVL